MHAKLANAHTRTITAITRVGYAHAGLCAATTITNRKKNEEVSIFCYFYLIQARNTR